jgi:hypothetical protein
MVTQSDYAIIESVGGVDEPYLCEDVVPNTSFSNMENVCLETTISLEDEVFWFVVIEVQVVFWKPHHRNSICWSLFVLNDGLHVDLEILQMLQCIVCISKNVVGNVLSQSFVLKKGLIKYNKINGIIPMKNDVDSIHPSLFAQRKSQFGKKATMGNDAGHVWQHGKKMTRPFSSIITTYFGSTNPFKKINEAQQMFIEDLVLYICKAY